MPFGVNFMRSQVLYWAAQVLTTAVGSCVSVQAIFGIVPKLKGNT